jgi:hypothetical protein
MTLYIPKVVLRLFAALAALATLTLGLMSPAQATATKHMVANLGGSTAPAALGYNVFDASVWNVDSLPAGVQGLVWLGQKCPTVADDTFKSKIDKLASDPKVFGYYLSDEPHIASCPNGPAALKTRIDYIRSKTSTQHTMVVFSKQADLQAFAPAHTDLDLVGLDPYPCSTANPTCDLSKIGERVGWADSAGVSRSSIVPVFQTFGQENTTSHYYNLPTAAQLQAMLDEWAKYVPAPVMDYSYSWGHQSSANPTLVDSSSLQSVMARHNGVAATGC